MYVYIESERVQGDDGFTRVNYTVGFYDPSGEWRPESDHGSPQEAARRVAWLNGKPA
ncbi:MULTISPECIES: hypothetical protein [Paraburkholderia]|uniref:Uncharacterized protein n=1 Tax=Paraburkholderia haematera TaxID=2793077 RepID=A0ABM8RI44_9BURK|nr:hypothetical protein [Paraburkholderia haematera]MCP2091299.1 hypothetical protein [Paraburkholderia sediminicola]CAE6754454.1 hypothetical protein R69888_03116 [Paraburkholderia haematera]